MHWYLLPVVLFGESLAHSWNEQLSVIEDGVFTGTNGYPRGYVSRTDPGFVDDMMRYQLPPLDSKRKRVDESDFLCAPTQRTTNQTANHPRLRVLPGAFVAMKYLENGHVTLPENSPGKPRSAGTVYVFGTNEPNSNELLTEVLKWTIDGTGGDKRGKLLTTQDFDDTRCYQINNGDISIARQEKFPNPIPGQPGSIHEQWCETDVAIPADTLIGSTYTIYWVWEWPTKPGTPQEPEGKDEYYTTCSDIDIVAGPTQEGQSNTLLIQDPQKAAVPNFKSRAAHKTNLLQRLNNP